MLRLTLPVNALSRAMYNTAVQSATTFEQLEEQSSLPCEPMPRMLRCASSLLRRIETVETTEEYLHRMLKMAVQQGRSERRGDAYDALYVELQSDAKTTPVGFFSILLRSCPRRNSTNIIVRTT